MKPVTRPISPPPNGTDTTGLRPVRPVRVEVPKRDRPPRRPAYRLLALDIDGTLLRDDKRLSTQTADAVRRASAAGVQVVLASARPPRSMRMIYERLGLNTVSIHYNGALILDPVLDRVLYHQPLKPDTPAHLVRHARRLSPEVLVHLEVEDRWITDRHDPRFQTETSRSFAPDVYGPLKPYLQHPVTKLMLMGSPETLAPIHQHLVPRFCSKVDIHITDRDLIQIVAKGVDKAQAVDRVARVYGIPERQVMAIGDATNDAQMLARAGLGLAMANGWDAAKDAADHVIGSNNDDGVADAIDRYLLGGEPR